MGIIQPGVPTSVGSWRTADGSTDPAEMRSRILRPVVVDPAQGNALISGVGRMLPVGPLGDLASVWRENEPAGYTTVINEDWSAYADETWVHTGVQEVDNQTSHPDALGPWSLVTHYLSEASIRSDGGGPISPGKVYRAFAYDGFTGGRDIARIVQVVESAVADGGFYCTFAMRISPSWAQGTSDAFTPKHVLWRTTQSAGGAFWGWNGWRNHTASGRFQMGLRVDVTNTARHNLPIINEEASLFDAGDWIIVEVAVTFNSGGAAGTPNTGRARMWLNGTLITDAQNQDYPIDRVRTCRPATTFGGGIGDVPNDQWYEFDHMYMSGPTP